ncbi:MAG: dTDP-4-dehydrorhamnose 3,5-epimerase [Pseudodesulfovibrio sp.]
MKIITTPIADVIVIEPRVFKDGRGFFLESFRQSFLKEAGIDADFVQSNTSRSVRGVLRGLHYQTRHPQGKLIRVSRGRVFDVAVDIRPSSTTFGQHFGIELNDEDHRQLWIPAGLAHGFCALSEVVDLHYRCTDYYDPKGEAGVLWNDPEIGIDWPVKDPILSSKDMRWPALAQLALKV